MLGYHTLFNITARSKVLLASHILKIVFKIGNYLNLMNDFFLETKLEFVKLFFFSS